MNTATRSAGFGAEVKRRIMLGTYVLSAGLHGRLLQPGPPGPHPDHRGVRRRLPALRRPARPDRPDHRLPPRGQDRRPAHHVPVRRLHHPDQPGRPPGHQRPLRHRATTACRSGCSCSARPCPRAPCSRWRRWSRRRPPRSSRRSWPRGPDREAGVGDGDRPRGPLRAEDGHQAVLRLPQRVRGRAQHQRVPGLPGPARLAAGPQPAGGGAGHGHRHRPPLRDPAVDLPPEELLLPRPGQGLPDQPVRRADQRGRPPRPARRVPGGDRAGPHGGGHRQDHPRRRLGTHPRGRLLAGRLQPLGRAAGRDRERPGHAVLGPGPGLRHRAAGRAGGLGGVGRQDGGGVDAGRRQRVGPALARTSPSGPGARSRTSTRSAPWAGPSSYEADRQIALLEAGGAGGPADPALGRGRRPHPDPPVQGGRLRLPLLPRARPGAPGPRRRVDPGRGRHHGPHAGGPAGPPGGAARRGGGATEAQVDQVATVVDLDSRPAGGGGGGRRGGLGPGPGPHGQRGGHRRRRGPGASTRRPTSRC